MFGLNVLGRVQRFGIRASRWCIAHLGELETRLSFGLSLPEVITVTLPTSKRKAALTLTGDVARAVYVYGPLGYEPKTIKLWCKLSQQADIVLDIGAHTGLFALTAADTNPECFVAAFEPAPHMYEILCRNTNAAGYGDRIRTERMALSNKDGTAELLIRGSSGSTLEHRFWEDSSALPQINVPCSTLDRWLAANSLRLSDRSLIKLDVETHEPSVMEGAMQAMEDGPAVVCEVLATFVEERLNAMLPSSRWRYFWIGPDGPTERRKIVGDPSWHHNNYLFLKRDSPLLSLVVKQ